MGYNKYDRANLPGQEVENTYIKDLRESWDEQGRLDPLRAILTTRDKNDTWDIDEFFASGQRKIDALMEYIKSLGINISQGKALDFGCGIGRLTQALAPHFNEVHGVDIAPSMIELANKYNRHGDRCRYHLNESADLKIFPDEAFNLICTFITLQHIKPQYAKNYIKEFIRILAPRGVLIFQIPGRITGFNGLIMRIVPKALLDATYRKVKYRNRPGPDSYWIKRQEVVAFLERNGGQVIDVQEKKARTIVNCQYCVTKGLHEAIPHQTDK